MTNKEAIKFLKEPRMWEWLNVAQQIAIDMAIEALEQQDKIIQILDDYDLEAWEILEKIKEVVRT